MKLYFSEKELFQVLRNKYLHFDKEKSGRRIINILLSVVIIIISFFIIKEIIGVISMETKINAVKKGIKITGFKIDSMEKEENKLVNDTSYIEKIAREQFGMVKRGEKVYIFVPHKRKNFLQRIIDDIRHHK